MVPPDCVNAELVILFGVNGNVVDLIDASNDALPEHVDWHRFGCEWYELGEGNACPQEVPTMDAGNTIQSPELGTAIANCPKLTCDDVLTVNKH